MMSPPEIIDISTLQGWIGKEEVANDVLTERLIRGLRAVFEPDLRFPSRADEIPLTAHWCLAPAVVPMSRLGRDGHPARGRFLPPISLPRRMWAGGELLFEAPYASGDSIRRTSRLAAIEWKEGRSGPLCFVAIEHTIQTARGVAVRERQNIVYRGEQGPSITAPTLKGHEIKADINVAVTCDPVLLFRYSALTFNAHRIHYDRAYAVNEEHYPGLVVHGPLQAGFLVELAAEMAGRQSLRRFTFRGVRPLFEGGTFALKGRCTDDGAEVWVEDAGGEMTMRGSAS